MKLQKTLIIQSASPNKPGWIKFCLDKTISWSRSKGYEYVFLGDELFDCLPEKFGKRTLLDFARVTLTDYARLMAIEWYLLHRKDTLVVWVDSDVLIIDDINFGFNGLREFACQEIWHDLRCFGKNYFELKTNNSIIGFDNLKSVQKMIVEMEDTLINDRITKLMGGPSFFKSKFPNFPVIRNVACPGKLAQNQLIKNPKSAIEYCIEIREKQGWPIHAANLCADSSNPKLMIEVISILMDSKRILADSEFNSINLKNKLINKTLGHHFAIFLRSKFGRKSTTHMQTT